MSLSLPTHKMLWGRSGNRCAICRCELVADATHADDPAVLGEAAHIVARETAGPRGESPLTPDQRDRYENLILLCPNHHTVIDAQPATWPVARLHELKREHESWVRTALAGFDPRLQQADEFYAAVVVEWETRMEVSAWRSWSSGLLSPTPHILAVRDTAWNDCRMWLFSRVWPQRRKPLEDAFENFRVVLEALCTEAHEHLIPTHGGEMLTTERFYKIREWNPSLYSDLVKEFEAHVDRVHELTRELTRAGNYVAEMVRECLRTDYRIEEGAILCESGPNGMLGRYDVERQEYPLEDRHGLPFVRAQSRAT